ncbi:unnamed protein product [Rotaria magnacalcarata]|uniref:Gag-pol polyprotein n=1 Tax=Rotaria magnacalcarata TaxID=392030 RepID=A0A819NRJ6_9BILA|nr:unnamed protein product [Rotaria magnacalcarata]
MTFYFQANNISLDVDRKPLFLWSIGDQVYNLLESLVAPRLLTEAELTYPDLIELSDKHYDDAKNINGQSFVDWKAELYDKARRCGFTTSCLTAKPIERAIRDMYVIGVKNPKIRQALLKEADPTLETAEKLILTAENSSSVDKIHDKQSNFNKKKFTSNKNRDIKSNNNHGKRRDSKFNSPDHNRIYNPCEACGSTKHLRSTCKFRDYACNFCEKNGHLEKVCRQKKNEQLSTKHITTVAKLISFNSCTSTAPLSNSSSMFSLEVNGNSITFELDTGSSRTIISKSDWHHIHSSALVSSKLRLKCYSDTYLTIIGECLVPVMYNNRVYHLKLIIVQDARPPLLGLQWIRSLRLDLNKLIHDDNQPDNYHLHQILPSSKLDVILQKYTHVLNNK